MLVRLGTRQLVNTTHSGMGPGPWDVHTLWAIPPGTPGCVPETILSITAAPGGARGCRSPCSAQDTPPQKNCPAQDVRGAEAGGPRLKSRHGSCPSVRSIPGPAPFPPGPRRTHIRVPPSGECPEHPEPQRQVFHHCPACTPLHSSLTHRTLPEVWRALVGSGLLVSTWERRAPFCPLKAMLK